ncbi:serine/threonine-protein kinase [Nocardiopsis dassonvillei]|uniref:serine/threonine-protein kinase n=1 Tax=Nocardiopsis dassonvillei TaxID=2014 RepID=UPI0008FCD4E4|nr:serine/threonine-protein kinase [Nocardiopsis dassonvillei]APC37416.1 serine/threonine protein kinase [Nocardiopsis dassonvillei]
MPSDGLPKNLEPLAAGDPATIGPYVLSGKLGSGGMGTVYLGSTPERNNQVAIKVIRPELAFDEATRARFRDEMENARKVASFCTAKVLDHGTFENRPYMVTEYIAGTALAEHIAENGPLDSSTLHGFALGVAAALAAIHRTGLVHRDLKPANVLLSLSGPRVIDFGIARAMNTATNHTQTGIVMGSPGWMAPEQLLEEKVTTSADIFAWGCLVAFAGNGTHPFGNGDAMTLGKRVLFAEPQIGNLISPLDRLVTRALAKEPGRRPTAQDLLLELAGGEDNSNPNDMVSHALHQSWRPNLPPMPPHGMPHPQQGPHQTMAGMRHPAPGQYQGAPPAPMPPPAHQTGNYPRPQGPPPGHPAGPPPGGQAQQVHQAPGVQAPGGQPQGGPVQQSRPVPGPAQAPHPASTGPIPMVPPADQQTGRRGPQPYVPPVPPPPHQPAAPNRRKGTVVALVLGAVALLAALIVMATVLTNLSDWSLFGDGDPQGDSSEQTGAAQEPQEPAPGDESPGGADEEEAPGEVPSGMSGASADRMVEYRIRGVSCGLTEHNIRSELPSTGQYCVVDLELFNVSDELVRFEHTEQQMTTSGEPVNAQAPSVREVEAPLWDPAGISPGVAAGGELVFILRDDMDPRTLVLNHRTGAEATEINIEHIVD